MQEFGDGGQRVEMLLELVSRHKEEDDGARRLSVDGFKWNAIGGSAQSDNEIGNQISRRMRNGDTLSNPSGNERFTLAQAGDDGGLMLRFNLLIDNKAPH